MDDLDKSSTNLMWDYLDDIKIKLNKSLVDNFGDEWSFEKIYEKIRVVFWFWIYYNILIILWYIIAYSVTKINKN